MWPPVRRRRSQQLNAFQQNQGLDGAAQVPQPATNARWNEVERAGSGG